MPATRILLDQNAPIGLRRFLADYEVVRHLHYQQNLQGRQIALIELSGGGWLTIRNHLDLVLERVRRDWNRSHA